MTAIVCQHTASELKQFAKTKKTGVPIVPDPERKIYGLFAEQYIPRNVLIGKEGNVCFTAVGDNIEEIRFSLFKFKLFEPSHPAWDFQ